MSRKRRWLGMNVAAALLAVLCTAANAQTTVVTPSPAQRCLTRGELLLGTPIYPQKSYEEKASGRVTVELEFRAADAAPRVLEIEAKTSDGSVHADRFERAVRDFIGAYRVPCLALNETARLKQEFVFVPHDGRGVTLMASSDEATRRAGQLLRCLRHQEPKNPRSSPSIRSPICEPNGRARSSCGSNSSMPTVRRESRCSTTAAARASMPSSARTPPAIDCPATISQARWT